VLPPIPTLGVGGGPAASGENSPITVAMAVAGAAIGAAKTFKKAFIVSVLSQAFA
jgi:hypothetical protein